jgi:hypothetical protein
VSQSVLDLSTGLIGLLALSTLLAAHTRFELFENKNLNSVFPWMLGYFVVACLGFYFNGRPGADIVFSLSRFSWILLLYVLTWSIRYLDFQSTSIKIFFYLLLVPAFYGFNIFFNHNVDLLESKLTDGRIIGIVQSATYHSHIGAFLFVAAFTWLYLEYFDSYRIGFKKVFFSAKTLYWIVTACVFLSVFYSRTRGALISVAVSVCILFAVKHKVQFLKWVFLPVVALLLILLATTPVKDSLVRKEGDSCRVVLALVHVEMVKTHPFFGIGYRDNMRQIADFWPESLRRPECESGRIEGSQAHNQLLNVAATTGLLGLFTYLGIVISFFIFNLRWYLSDRSNLALTCLITQIFFQLSCLTEITFEFAKIRFLILVVWALVAARAPVKKLPPVKF